VTVPRQVLPGKLVCITRRCSERRFFLRPDRRLNELVAYLLAVGCEKFGLELLGVVVMSNHYHLAVHDRHGRHPAFTQWFNALLARAGNHLRRRTDAFWAVEQVNVAELADPEAVLDNLAYLAANPVEALAVRHGRDWPGLRTDPGDHLAARPRIVRRPKGFFRDESELPERATLRLVRPPTHAHLTTEAFAEELASRVDRLEAAHRRKAEEERAPFLGPGGVRRQPCHQRPVRAEPHGAGRVLRPQVIAQCKQARCGVLARIFTFRAAYAEALAAFAAGARDAIFPYGTWLHPRLHGARCHPPP